MPTTRSRLSILVAALILSTAPAFAQHAEGMRANDTSSTVSALQDFHPVIFKIWHAAWPAKDTAALAALLPEIETGAGAIARAELPGILREKSAAWKIAVDRLGSGVDDYRAAVTSHNGQRLLDAAEMLHARYEALARVVKPPLRELEGFHASLYVLYHHVMPRDSLAAIRSSVEELKTRMAILNAAILPERLRSKDEAFKNGRSRLVDALNRLDAALASNDLERIRPAVNFLHEQYEALAQTLE